MDIPTFSQSPFRLSSQMPLYDGGNARKPMGSAPPSATIDSSSRRQNALHIFERTLSMGYEKLKASQGPAAQFTVFEPLTAEKVADNILGFIERRLQMDAAEGATQEQLQTRLEAGLAGFKQGFAEASEKLKALSLLSPEIAQDIGKTYELVLTGIDALRQNFLTDVIKAESAKPAQVGSAGIQQQAHALLTKSGYHYAIADSFSFQLVTAEGDKVKISANTNRAFATEHNSAVVDRTSGRVTTESLTASYSASSAMNWSVQGDLNEGEAQAINNLLGQINNLSDSFFNGNFDQAFNQALELGYDKQQITAFSLNLTQVEVQRASSAYRQFNGAPVENLAPDLHERLLPLGNFIKNLLEALDAASVFQQPQELLGELSEKMVAPYTREFEPGKSLRNFIEQVFRDLDK